MQLELQVEGAEEIVPLDVMPIVDMPSALSGGVLATSIRGTLPNGKTFTCLLDGHSHLSGTQRAFVVCPLHTSEHCQKFRFVNQDASPQHSLAWVAAWVWTGYFKHSPCLEHHRAECDPSDADVAAVFSEHFT